MTKPVDLRTARANFAEVMARVEAVEPDLTAELQDEIGFVAFSERVDDPDLRRRFRSAAIELLDANLRDHWTVRPEVAGTMSLARTQEVLDWIEATWSWQSALAALLKQSDA